MKTADTIIFDLSEVLLHGLLGSKKKMAGYLKVSLDTLELNTPELTKLFLGDTSEEKYLASLIRQNQVGKDKNIDALKKIVRDGFSEIEGTRSTIIKLREKKYKLGLLSVHAREWIEFCEKAFQYHSLFDHVLYSFEIGICKPEKESYLLILDRMSSDSDSSIFIDDSLNNIKGASSIGMQSILFKSSQQLEDELRLLNINI